MDPADLVATLAPAAEAVIKREERTLVWRERRPDGTPTVVKLYRRRSTGSALRSRLLRFRAEREYRRLSHLMRWGVPCTEPLAWGRAHSADHGHHEVLVMREVPNAAELGEEVRARGGDIDLAPLFGIVRRMHESGFQNQTLYARNVLVDTEAPPEAAYFIADVPRSWTFPGSIVGTSMALWDLLDLAVELEEAGVTVDQLVLSDYGLDRAGRRWWERHRKPAIEPRTKRVRARRDGAARLRWGTGWATGWWKRGRGGSRGRGPKKGEGA